MARNSKIPWTDSTWNPIRGCDIVSPGCKFCYAARTAHRYPWGRGLTVIKADRPQWSGKVELVPHALDQPLRWQRPSKIFPCSGADYLHDEVPLEYIAAMFAVACAAPRHTFQFLTKRPKRLRELEAQVLLRGKRSKPSDRWLGKDALRWLFDCAVKYGVDPKRLEPSFKDWMFYPRNAWLGVSVESPAFLWRIDELMSGLPADVFWTSLEPLLDRVDIRPALRVRAGGHRLGWVVVGGESGVPGRDCRPCAMEWIEEVKDACLEERVPVFVKQLGSWVVSEERMADSIEEARELFNNPEMDHPWLWAAGLEDMKGEDPEEWPEHYRVQLFPGDPLPDPADFRLAPAGEECPF